VTTGLSSEEGVRPSRSPNIEPWISVDDLARILGVSADWVYERAASRELPSYKFGGHRRFRISEVEEWASRCASK
jgi:excisionase family DNA binding protein